MRRALSSLTCLLVLLTVLSPLAAGMAGAASTATGADGGRLTVTAKSDADPVAGARVVVRQDGEVVVRGRTTDDGQLATGRLDHGTYEVTVVKSGYYAREFTVVVDGSESRVVHLDRGSVELTVQVRDDRTDDPVTGATVDVSRAGTVRTLADGSQTVEVPVNTELSLEVSKDGYTSVTRSVAVGETATTVNVSLRRAHDLRVSLAADRVVTGENVTVQVTDAYGDPVENAAVLLDGERVARTGGDGRATVRVDSPGEHTIRVRVGSRLSEAATLTGLSPDDESTGTPTNATTPNESTPTATATPQPTETDEKSRADAGIGGIAGLPSLPSIAGLPSLPSLAGLAGPVGDLLAGVSPQHEAVMALALIGLVGMLLFGLRSSRP